MTVLNPRVGSPQAPREPQEANAEGATGRRLPVCLVGPGWTFTGGLSYYTCRLANALAEDHQTSVIQLRGLIPRRLYPGRRRVGEQRSSMAYHPGIPVFNGIDWWWGLSLVRALGFLRAQRPGILVLQWWTVATLHTYLVLAAAARLLGTRVVVELHEVQDPGEANMSVLRHYARWGLRSLLWLAYGCVVHSKADWQLLKASGQSLDMRIAVAPHGPYDQYCARVGDSGSEHEAAIAAVRSAPRPEVVNILFFGLIRPYKGLEDLVRAFSSLSEQEAASRWLTVVGETWEGCTEPARLIKASPHADRITFVNEYVPDEVVAAAFAHADLVVLPYHRSSSSGILHVAMSWGLPVVLTDVGGLPEAADGYAGAVFVPPGDPAMLNVGIDRAVRMVGQRFADPRDWSQTTEAIRAAADLCAAQ